MIDAQSGITWKHFTPTGGHDAAEDQGAGAGGADRREEAADRDRRAGDARHHGAAQQGQGRMMSGIL